MAQAFRDGGHLAELYDDHFPQNAADVEWIPVVVARGWVIVSRDQAIHRNPLERAVLFRAGARAFILTSSNVTGVEAGTIFLRHIEKIEALVREKPPPFIARVNRTEVVVYPGF